MVGAGIVKRPQETGTRVVAVGDRTPTTIEGLDELMETGDSYTTPGPHTCTITMGDCCGNTRQMDSEEWRNPLVGPRGGKKKSPKDKAKKKSAKKARKRNR